jgi:hypothetical protein
MRTLTRYLLPIACAAMLGGCGMKESYDISGAKAKEFHDRLSAEQYDTIWANTASDLRKDASREEFTALLTAVNRKLGKVVEAKQVNWHSNTVNGVTMVTMNFDTRFERGKGKETIVFRWVSDDRLALAGYTINSNDMLVN